MGCTYVKDFDFGAPKVQVKAYARGGPVKKLVTQREELLKQLPAKGRRSVPVAPTAPLVAMKKGGKASCGCK
jgi:hypothetical protein